MIIKLEENGRVLHFCSSRMWKKGSDDENIKEVVYEERFVLGEDVDPDKVSAHLADGVLEVTFAKKEKEDDKVTTKVIPTYSSTSNPPTRTIPPPPD